MNKFNALKQLWSMFGLQAYEESTVPSTAVMPYITYQVTTGSIDGEIPLSASLWYRGTSWAQIMKKATEIEQTIDTQIKIDGGYLKVRKNRSNFASPMSDPSDDKIRRIVLRVNAEFITN